MKVYVVESGCYTNRSISGVYSSVEAAIAANPIPANYPYPVVPSASNASRPTGWVCTDSEFNTWYNGLDWDDAKEIMEFELDV